LIGKGSGFITGGDGGLPPGGSINIGGGGGGSGGGSININPGNPGGYINPGPGVNIATKQCLNGGHRIMEGLPCTCPKGYYGNKCEYSNFGGGNINIGGGGINMGGGACYNNPCRNGVREKYLTKKKKLK
jgi:hypothetical protein